jgi:hypothetical protein
MFMLLHIPDQDGCNAASVENRVFPRLLSYKPPLLYPFVEYRKAGCFVVAYLYLIFCQSHGDKKEDNICPTGKGLIILDKIRPVQDGQKKVSYIGRTVKGTSQRGKIVVEGCGLYDWYGQFFTGKN